MQPVTVRIFHAEPGPSAGPLERRLADARRALAERHVDRFRAAGAADVTVVAGPPDDTPLGARLRQLVAKEHPRGLVVLGSGAIPLARRRDIRAFVDAAARDDPFVLANNRYSADVVAIARPDALLGLPDLPSDNALPRWLEEVVRHEVTDLGRRRRLAIDLDSPADLLLLPDALREQLTDRSPLAGSVAARLAAVAAVAADRRGELVVAGRTSGRTVRWLERRVPARVRALIEERGLRASTSLAVGDGGRRVRPPRSVLGLVLDHAGPDALGPILAELGDAAVVDTRVLLAHRLGPVERAWPPAEDRFASDLLLPEAVADPWLGALTASALAAPIPIVLGGHTLVGPGLPLVLRRAVRGGHG